MNRSTAAADGVYLQTYLAPLGPWLDRADVTEILINRPGEIWVEANGVPGMTRVDVPDLSELALQRLAAQVARANHQGLSRAQPLLSGQLPGGERIQLIAPPATRQHLAIAIRKHVQVDLGLDDYAASGAFDHVRHGGDDPAVAADVELRALLDAGRVHDFLVRAVAARKTILVAGGTSSGKTTFLNALLKSIDPAERLITIEDTAEVSLDRPNALGLIAVRGDAGEAEASSAASSHCRTPGCSGSTGSTPAPSTSRRSTRSSSNLRENLRPPKWPGTVKTALVARGAAIFARSGSCAGCHAVRAGLLGSWKTPVLDVCTDRRNHDVIDRRVDTGVVSGAYIPFYFTLKPHDYACNVLLLAAVGSDVQHMAKWLAATGQKDPSNMCSPTTKASYEARVLDGVWAAAPYLHNGSVRSLTELLLPSSQRSSRFAVGPAYDLTTVGLAERQPASATTLVTTGCDERDGGNSRCGHEGPAFGTTLPAADKVALIEYLKTLQTLPSSTPIPQQSTGLGCPA